MQTLDFVESQREKWNEIYNQMDIDEIAQFPRSS